jgi:hypothetical protein
MKIIDESVVATIRKIVVALVLIAGTVGGPAHAGMWDKVKDAYDDQKAGLQRAASIPASIDSRNETDGEIIVEMDRNRERHRIAPRGQATFGEAHVGDKPTFYVKHGDTVQFARQVNIAGGRASYGWNGSRF